LLSFKTQIRKVIGTLTVHLKSAGGRVRLAGWTAPGVVKT